MSPFKVVITDFGDPDHSPEAGVLNGSGLDIDLVRMQTRVPEELIPVVADADGLIVQWATDQPASHRGHDPVQGHLPLRHRRGHDRPAGRRRARHSGRQRPRLLHGRSQRLHHRLPAQPQPPHHLPRPLGALRRLGIDATDPLLAPLPSQRPDPRHRRAGQHRTGCGAQSRLPGPEAARLRPLRQAGADRGTWRGAGCVGRPVTSVGLCQPCTAP